MLGRINKESNFAEVFRCLFNPEKDYLVLLKSPDCQGSSFSELAREFQTIANLRPIKRLPVRHIFLSFTNTDRQVSEESKIAIVNKVIQQMGFESCQYIAVEVNLYDLYYSGDRDLNGIHIIANAVNLQGRKVVDFKDAHKLAEILREIQTSLDVN
jgi:Relaxase/Mobilisation nuclease domain